MNTKIDILRRNIRSNFERFNGTSVHRYIIRNCLPELTQDMYSVESITPEKIAEVMGLLEQLHNEKMIKINYEKETFEVL